MSKLAFSQLPTMFTHCCRLALSDNRRPSSALDALYTGLRSPAPLTISSSNAARAAGGGGSGGLMIRAGPVASMRMGMSGGASSSAISSSTGSTFASVSASPSKSRHAGPIGSASPADNRVVPGARADAAVTPSTMMRPHSATSFSSRILTDAANIGSHSMPHLSVSSSHSLSVSSAQAGLIDVPPASAHVGSKRRASAVIDIDVDCEFEIVDVE